MLVPENRDKGNEGDNVGLKVFYTNARSIRNKKNELFSYIAHEEPDIVGITESWVNENIFNDSLGEYFIDKYKLFTYQRQGRIGGGVMLYIKNKYVVSEVTEIKQNDEVESLWVDIRLNRRKIRIGIFYRSPNSNREIDLGIVNEINRGSVKDAILLGDFNFPNIDWELMEGADPCSRMLLDCIRENFLTQLVREPTRTNQILDLVLTNSLNIKDLEVGETLSSSDHNIIRFKIVLDYKLQDNLATRPNFSEGDYDRLRMQLGRIDWVQVLGNSNVEEMWGKFKNILHNTQEECIPSTNIRQKASKPRWWGNDIGRMIKDKKRAFKLFKQDNREANLIRYQNCRDSLKRAIRQKKRTAEMNLARNCSKNSKSFFSYYNINRKEKAGIGPLKVGDVIIDKNEDVANNLNEYFSSVFIQDNDPINTASIDGTQDVLNHVCIKESDIRAIIGSMKPNKAPGPDEIYARILKEGVNELVKPLKIIFEKSMLSGKIPKDWKTANVVPIFKKGSRKQLQNYRPVSLTSLVGKILEKIIHKHIQEFLDRNELVKESQHGFREGRSCLTNLLDFTNYITKELDQDKAVDIIYLDFSKAFDKVSHVRLLHKLKMHGISGMALRWIGEWLANRKQRVILNGYKSGWANVTSGVPQGSVLGPLLFILYINDIDKGIKGKISKFADDTKMAIPVDSLEGPIDMQKNLDKLMGWADKWKMEFNASKCKVMHLGRQNREFTYTMRNSWLNSVEEEKDLGVCISNNFKVNKQCIQARNKANKMLGIINRNVSYKSREVVTKLYNSYVRPHLEYCVQAWKPYQVQDISMLEAVQRRATKMVNDLSHLNYSERLERLDMFSVKGRFLRGDLIQVYKLFSGIDKVDVGNYFTLNENRLRGHSRTIWKPSCRLDVRKYHFSNRIIDTWNKLPENVVNSESLSTFKKNLDIHMGVTFRQI